MISMYNFVLSYIMALWAQIRNLGNKTSLLNRPDPKYIKLIADHDEAEKQLHTYFYASFLISNLK